MDVTTKEKFERMVVATSREFPYSINTQMRGEYHKQIKWLGENNILDYNHYTCTLKGDAVNVMCFRNQSDAVMFALRWL